MDKMLSGRRLLVVEDEMLILMTIEDMLGELGCASVKGAATVDKALALMVGEDFDAAMLDVNLNGEKSYPVADALAARDVPFFFSTGYSDSTIGEDYPGRPVLTKPYRYEDLVAMLTRLLPR